MKHFASTALITLALAGCSQEANHQGIPLAGDAPQKLASPSGNIQMVLRATDAGPTLAVYRDDRVLFAPAPLNISIDGRNLGDHAGIVSTLNYSTNASYATRGTHSTATDRCNGLQVELASKGGTHFFVNLRAYDDGVAFSFNIPATGSTGRVPDESSTIQLPEGSQVWIEAVRGHYEDIPMKSAVESIGRGTFAAPPMTVELAEKAGGGFASFTEAAVYNYPGAVMEAQGNRHFSWTLAPHVTPSYPFTLRYGDAGAKRITTPAPIDGDITTPWRVILIGKDLNTLVNSDIITNLNPPPDEGLFPQGQATDWIKPGRAVWQYLDGPGDQTLEGAKAFSQLASMCGFQYNVIEGYWTRWSDEQIRELADYSNARGVGLWFWFTSDSMREVRRASTGTRMTRPLPANAAATHPAASTRPANQRMPNPDLYLRDAAARRAIFEKLASLGVKGLKIDFIDTEALEAEIFYHDCLRDAAEAHLLVNFHGSSKPTGEQRTFPNELTREAVPGLEHRRFPPNTSAEQTQATLPFTRFLCGSADYTPVIFNERRFNTTATHQIATAVVMTSVLQTYAAHPKNLLSSPGFPIIKTLPATWDETRVLPPSKIGEIAVYARRSGNDWYVGVMNAQSPMTLNLPLTFLPDGAWKADLLYDAEQPTAITPQQRNLTNQDTLPLTLQPGGGFVARFTR